MHQLSNKTIGFVWRNTQNCAFSQKKLWCTCDVRARNRLLLMDWLYKTRISIRCFEIKLIKLTQAITPILLLHGITHEVLFVIRHICFGVDDFGSNSSFYDGNNSACRQVWESATHTNSSTDSILHQKWLLQAIGGESLCTHHLGCCFIGMVSHHDARGVELLSVSIACCNRYHCHDSRRWARIAYSMAYCDRQARDG